MPRPAVIHFADTTFPSFFTVERNQLDPSADLYTWPILPVTTGASAADIHLDCCQREESRASVLNGSWGAEPLQDRTEIAVAAPRNNLRSLSIL